MISMAKTLMAVDAGTGSVRAVLFLSLIHI